MSLIAACFSNGSPEIANHQASQMAIAQKHRGSVQVSTIQSSHLQIQFCGTIYNPSSLRSRLQSEHAFASISEGELLLHLYESKGVDFLAEVEGVFALVIREGNQRLIVARDRLGQIPLYRGHTPEGLLFASEFKAFSAITSDFSEFPINTLAVYDLLTLKLISEKAIHPEFEWAQESISDPALAAQNLRQTLQDAVIKRVAQGVPGIYLSGGLDSSIIAALTARTLPGLHTFAVGYGESPDLQHAQALATKIGSAHHEYRYDLNEMLRVLPEVIGHLETFDAALVRSSVPNYLVARMTSQFVNRAFSGEGADELFGGYAYMLELSQEQLAQELLDILKTLGNTGLQRGDRMSMAFGISPDVPFLDQKVIELALKMPLSFKIGPQNEEKWIVREAFADMLPVEITRRKKQKFSAGAGSQLVIAQAAENLITDHDYAREKISANGHTIQSKEELFYYRIFRERFPELAAEQTVAFSKSL